jgi:PAS domain-containing protein
MERRFSRFIIYILVAFQGISLALVVGILYGILSRTMISNFHNQIRGHQVEVSTALNDRIAHLYARLQALSLSNAVRVSLMLGVENPILEVMHNQYPDVDGAFFCVKGKESAKLLPGLPERLAPLKGDMERIEAKKVNRMIRFEESDGSGFHVLLSAPIMRKDERLGTAFVCYSLSEDRDFWERLGARSQTRLYAQSDHVLVDLRTGKRIRVSNAVQTPDNNRVKAVRTDLVPGQALLPLHDFPGIFYATSSLPLEAEKEDLILILTALCAIIFLSTLLVAFLIARKVTHPLSSMADQAQEIAREPSDRFLNAEGIRHSEFRRLTQAFNQVLASLFEAQKELKRSAEKELAASEERYRRTLEAAPDAITLTTLKEERFLQVNEAFCKMTGFSAEEAVGRTAADLDVFTNPADRNKLVTELKEKGAVNGLEIR